jgi:DNA-binding NtrC family response regulator
MATVLIADDERSICEAFAALVSSEGHVPRIASNGEDALREFSAARPDAVFLDVRMPGRDGIAILKEMRARDATVPVIIMTAHGSLATAGEALRANAFDYLGKPLELSQARSVLRRALHRPGGGSMAVDATAAARASTQLVGNSAAMQEIFKLIVLLADNELTVLVQGESGVGKELVARAVHEQGARRNLPFVAVNCAAIPETLIESVLFGHERGAFTDARETRTGLFEAAGRGTLFLDEISELPLHLQSKLLRVLQERSFERVGSVTAMPFAARVIAASNRDLAAAVADGKFRDDLFHRLNLVSIRVPPLRERLQDIPGLVQALLARANAETGKLVRAVEMDVIEMLQRHSWPGNVRELEHTIKRAVLLAKGDTLSVHDVQLESLADGAAGAPADELRTSLRRIANRWVARGAAPDGEAAMFADAVGTLETALIEAALGITQGNRAAAAKLLGINRATLRNKLPDGEPPE